MGANRVLSTNLLGTQMKENTLKEILKTADQRTKANLTRKTPQLTKAMEEIEKWLRGEEEAKN